MGDLISRQAMLDGIDNLIKIHFDRTVVLYKARKVAEDLPSAQPETAKRIVGKSRDGMTLWYQCDMCNEPVDAQDDYCRRCGRRLIDG